MPTRMGLPIEGRSRCVAVVSLSEHHIRQFQSVAVAFGDHAWLFPSIQNSFCRARGSNVLARRVAEGSNEPVPLSCRNETVSGTFWNRRPRPILRLMEHACLRERQHGTRTRPARAMVFHVVGGKRKMPGLGTAPPGEGRWRRSRCRWSVRKTQDQEKDGVAPPPDTFHSPHHPTGSRSRPARRHSP